MDDSGAFACFDAVQKPRHVAPELPHDLHALQVLPHVVGRAAVHHRPVAGSHHGHVEELDVLGELVERRRRARAARAGDDGGGLVAEVRAARIGKAVHQARHVARHGGIVDRAAENKGVRPGGLFDDLVHYAAENALALAAAGAAADAPADGLVADPEDFDIDALFG